MNKNIQEFVGNKVCKYLKERDEELLFYKNASKKMKQYFKKLYDVEDEYTLFTCQVEDCPFFAATGYNPQHQTSIDSNCLRLFKCCGCGAEVCEYHFESSKFLILDDDLYKHLPHCSTNYSGLSCLDFYDWYEDLKDNDFIKYRGDGFPMCRKCNDKISEAIQSFIYDSDNSFNDKNESD